MNINSCVIGGNITKKPEIKYTTSGFAICEISVAINSQRKTKDGEVKKEVSFIPVKVLGRTAENTAKYCDKGDPVVVEGVVKQESWQTKEGENRSKILVVANRIHFCGNKKAEPVCGEGEELNLEFNAE
jgi:single-strand DNA-binding protein